MPDCFIATRRVLDICKLIPWPLRHPGPVSPPEKRCNLGPWKYLHLNPLAPLPFPIYPVYAVILSNK